MSSDLHAELGKLLDSDRVRPPREYETAIARVVAEPANLSELGELILKCERDRVMIAPIGACRTILHLRSQPVDAAVSLVRMPPTISHEPDDMTVVAGAGITLAALATALGRHGQYLPVDPAFPERTTVGAMLAAAQGGPLRLSAGTARDFLIGVQFVGHGGRIVRGGGRVVKNVAGYDLMKVMIGSFGTLGIITEATFKVRPLPEVYVAVLSHHAEMLEGFEAGFRLHEALPLLHLELLSPGLRMPLARDGHYLLAAGVGGNRPDVDYQVDEIRKTLPGSVVLEGGDAQKFYRAVRDVELPETSVKMQISVLPRQLPACLKAHAAHFRAHVASGVAQAALNGDAQAVVRLRSAAVVARGNARVLAMDPALRGAAFFDEPAAGVLKLMRGLKTAFDPAGIFNPGCFVGGI
ncbi:MAG TPA: FAD-binding oxidoreductase [Candidatus Binataceae bacterium]|nr:FAD-binding oxidoreductase [Candidatus Binataceae bacterium]